ncbi:PPA1309 family protein [Jatrophihabitans fulvus]
MDESGLTAVLAEIEAHVHASGWDRAPSLFALVTAGRFTADDPETASRMGIDALPADALCPVEQDDLPDQPLDELLAGIAWPDSVDGCAVVQEIVILPPGAEETSAEDAARNPDRREARLVAAALREGTDATLLRLRDPEDPSGDGELVTGDDLAPNLVAALRDTLR